MGLLAMFIPDGGFGIAIYIVAFFATITVHAMTLEQQYHIIQSYLYIRINLGTPITFYEAKHLLLLFAPSDEGRWYPMTGIRELPIEYRHQVLLDSARKIYLALGYEFGLDINDSTKDYGPNKSGEEKQNISDLPSGLSHLVAMLCEMAKGDGRITKEEIDVIDSFFVEVLNMSSSERKYAIGAFTKAKTADVPYEIYVREFYKIHRADKKMLEGVVGLLLNVAYADGELSAEEAILLNQVIAIFGVGTSEYNERKSTYDKENTGRGVNSEEARYAKVLGLEANITPEKVKSAYRKLAVQYHPDKVSHLGSRLREVAEEEMKKINEAYQYLQKVDGK